MVLHVLLRQRNDERKIKVVEADANTGLADLLDWVLDEHRGWRFAKSWEVKV